MCTAPRGWGAGGVHAAISLSYTSILAPRPLDSGAIVWAGVLRDRGALPWCASAALAVWPPMRRFRPTMPALGCERRRLEERSRALFWGPPTPRLAAACSSRTSLPRPGPRAMWRTAASGAERLCCGPRHHDLVPEASWGAPSPGWGASWGVTRPAARRQAYYCLLHRGTCSRMRKLLRSSHGSSCPQHGTASLQFQRFGTRQRPPIVG